MTFKSIERDVLYNILSRLRHRCNLLLEFTPVKEENWTQHVERPMAPAASHETKKLLEEVNCFSLNYLIEALCSRGAVVNDHFLKTEETRHNLVKTIVDAFKESEVEDSRFITLATLERMLNTIDENLEIRDIVQLFRTCHAQERSRSSELKETEERQKAEGFLRVRKVVITPTRVLFVVPEMMMGNKFLREFDPTGEQTLRVQFRDDSGQKMRKIDVGDALIEKTIKQSYNGITIAGRNFRWIGASNSQMRDHGCYFVDTTDKDLRATMKKCVGDFDDDIDPIKSMARFAQTHWRRLRHRRGHHRWPGPERGPLHVLRWRRLDLSELRTVHRRAVETTRLRSLRLSDPIPRDEGNCDA
uniref:RNA-dependent RNA polymerase n=1 Tax=Steinernema glaseri TaxID=37863 RepID=A0A1I7Z6Z6_9BILA